MKAWAAVTSGQSWSGESEEAYEPRLAKWDAGAFTLECDADEREFIDSLGRRRRRKQPVRHIGLREQYGVLGFARAFEATYGENGWHPHLHAVLVLEGQVAKEDVYRLGEAMFDRWEISLSTVGVDTWKDYGGLDIKHTVGEVSKSLSTYLSKSMDIALEVTHGQVTKTSGRGGRTPFQILSDAVLNTDYDQQTGEALPNADRALWREWEQASHGHKQLTWSVGLREMAGLAREATDEEIAEADLGSETLLGWDNKEWTKVAGVQIEVLEIAVTAGLGGVIAWCESRGIEYLLTRAGWERLGQVHERAEVTQAERNVARLDRRRRRAADLRDGRQYLRVLAPLRQGNR